jgi:hypothetical protein
MLVQACIGRIGLAKFLYKQKVPRIQTAQCCCRAREETVWHIALYCIEETEQQQSLQTNKRLNYNRLIGTASRARQLAEWVICSRRLG